MKKWMLLLLACLAVVTSAACTNPVAASEAAAKENAVLAVSQAEMPEDKAGPEAGGNLTDEDTASAAPPREVPEDRTELVLGGADGEIHYSYHLPQDYDVNKTYPMMVVMPGYDRMWFGEESSGSNLDWRGFLVWTERDEEMIVVSAQLTDWGEKSARQAIELTEYFLQNFAIDPNRVYAAGYSAGGETMSRAVSMRPDLYAAYLHGASQWDGAYAPVAENGVAVYIFMAENDEYYGSQKARDAYNGLRDAYRQAGCAGEKIDAMLQLEIPDNAYFNSRGVYNYHGGGNLLFEDETILNWVLQQKKPE